MDKKDIKDILRWGWKGLETWNTLSSLGVTALLKVVFRDFVSDWQWYDQLFLFGGIFLLLLVLSLFFAPKIKQWLDDDGTEKDRGKLKNTDMNLDVINDGFKFYSTREELSKYHPTTKLYEANEIWACWNAPVKFRSENHLDKTNIEKLILPHPDNKCFDSFADTVTETKAELISYICGLTKSVIEKRKQQDADQFIQPDRRIQIHWHQFQIGNTITIGNPRSAVDSDDSWILLGIFAPYTYLPKRPSIWLKRKPYDILFDDVFAAFNKMWESSEPPSVNDITKYLS
ncbi:MAG TPA: hypothetical protein DCX22_03255 [Dehalococcoidia bacterium]|nr:hypothetical protein [Dehalococcoidia bacterium]